MSDKFVFRPSRLVGLLLAGGGALSVAGALIIPIYAVARALLAVLLCVLFFLSIRRHACLRGAEAVRGLSFRRNEVALLDADGAPIDAGAVVFAFVSPVLSTVVVAGRRRHALLLMPDSLPAEDYRRLRIRLNIAAAER